MLLAIGLLWGYAGGQLLYTLEKHYGSFPWHVKVLAFGLWITLLIAGFYVLMGDALFESTH